MSVPRRRDVYHNDRVILPGQRRRNRRGGPSGVDAEGRFIGEHDLDRALRYFWGSPHRRGAAPIVRDMEFGRGTGGASTAGGRGAPVRWVLSPAQLREMHASRRAGVKYRVLAERYHVPQSTIAYHLRPSAAMRGALAQAPSPS